MIHPRKKTKVTRTGNTKPMPPSVAASFRKLAAYADEQVQNESAA